MPRSEKQLANDQRLRDAAAQKREKVETIEEPTISKSEFEDLLKQVSELKSQLAQPNQFQPQYVPQQTQVTAQGMIGTTDKYSTDETKYEDPTDRLRKESRLRRFAFDENYDLTFRYDISAYKDINGVNIREPRFEIDLIGVIFDDITGEPTNKRYVIRKLIFHEDPEAALEVARRLGISVSTNDETAFLNEMRYIRAKEWLLDIFFPPVAQKVQNQREEVIGNTVVKVFEVTSDKEEAIKF